MSDNKHIYFYFNSEHERPLYVGQTVNIVNRFQQHIRENRLFLLTNKIYYTKVPDGWNKDQVDIWESFFITFTNPIISDVKRKFFVANTDSFTAIVCLYEALKDSKDFKGFLNEYCDVVNVKNGVIDIGRCEVDQDNN